MKQLVFRGMIDRKMLNSVVVLVVKCSVKETSEVREKCDEQLCSVIKMDISFYQAPLASVGILRG